MKSLKKQLFVILFILINCTSFSQTDLREDADFLRIKINEYDEWLAAKGFGDVLIVDSFTVEEHRVSVFLGYPAREQSDFSLNLAWQMLKNEYESKGKTLLEESLFNTLFFTLEVSPDSLQLIILGKQEHLFKVEILGSEVGVVVIDKIAQARDAEKIPIPIINLKTKYIQQKDKIKSADLNKITSEIRLFLQNYYKAKGAWWYFAEVEVVKDFEHDLIIEITDLKNEVLKNERDYFEYIRISIKAEKQNNNVVLTYDLMAKYGSGIFLAPRSVNDYKNMEIKYANSLENYREKIKSLIHKQLIR